MSQVPANQKKSVPGDRRKPLSQVVAKINHIFKDFPDASRDEFLLQLTDADPVSRGLTDDSSKKRFHALISQFVALDPHDQQEINLALQLVSTHNMMMDQLIEANTPGIHLKLLECRLKFAEKFGNLYLRQLEALEKYRTKSPTEINVGHLEVSNNSQAIIGPVAVSKRRENAPADGETPVNQGAADDLSVDLDEVAPRKPQRKAKK